MREKKKKVEKKNVEFRQRGYRNSSAQFCCPGVRGVRGGKKIVTIVAMALPKMRKKKKKSGFEIYGRVKKKCLVHNIFTTFSQ